MLNIALGYDITSRNWDNTDVDVNITDPDGFNGIKDIDNNNTRFSEGTLTDVVAVNDGLELASNYALSFDGDNDYAELFSPLTIFDKSFKIEGTFYFEEEGRDILFGNYTIGSSPYLNFERYTDNKLRVYWDGLSIYTLADVIEIGKWQKIAFERDKINGKINFYVNDVLVYSENTTVTDKTVSTIHRIGRDSRTGVTAFSGKISSFNIYENGSLILNYKIDKGIDTTIFDSAGTNDGTINGATWVTDTSRYLPTGNRLSPTIDLSPIGNVESSIINWESIEGLSFDGDYDYVDCGDSEEIQIIGDVSFGAKIKTPASLIDRNPFIWCADVGEIPSTNVLYGVKYDTDGTLFIGHEYGNGTNELYNTSGSYIQPNTEYDIFIKRDTLNTRYEVYIDNDFKEYINYINQAEKDSSGNTQWLAIGVDSGAVSELYQGIIYNTVVWNKLTSEQEMIDSLNENLVGDETGLVVYYRIDKGTGTTLIDSAGINNGTINGASWLSDLTTITIETSVDGGLTWQTATNGSSILNITDIDTSIDVRQTLSTTDTTVTPRLESLNVEIETPIEYKWSLDTIQPSTWDEFVSNPIIQISEGQWYLHTNYFENNARVYEYQGTYDIDKTPPNSPSVNLTNKTIHSLSLDWTNSDSLSGIDYVELYAKETIGTQIDINGDLSIEDYIILTSADVIYTVDGLSENTQYDYKIITYDMAGNSTEDGFYTMITSGGPVVAALSTSESTSLLSNVNVDSIIEAEKSISITESKTAEQITKYVIEAERSTSSSNSPISLILYGQKIKPNVAEAMSAILSSIVKYDYIVQVPESVSITESKTAEQIVKIAIEAICSVSSSNGLIPEVNYDKILTVQKTASISSALPLSINILIEAERSTSSSNSPIPLISHGQKMKPNVAESRSAILSTIVNYDYIVQALESVSISGSFSAGISSSVLELILEQANSSSTTPNVVIKVVINIQLDSLFIWGQTITPEVVIEEPNNIYPFLPRIYLDVNPPEVTGEFVPGTITGNVNKRDIPVSEAKIIIINSITEEVETIVYTDANGEYSAQVSRYDIYHVLVEYQDDDGYWQAESIPFVKPEIDEEVLNITNILVIDILDEEVM